MPAPIERLTQGERAAYDALTTTAGQAEPSPTERDLINALEELARRREADDGVTVVVEAPRTDVARMRRIRELIDVELDYEVSADESDDDRAKTVAMLADALHSLSAVSWDDVVSREEHAAELATAAAGLAASQVALEGAGIRINDLELAVTKVRAELIDLGPGAELLLEPRLQALGRRLEDLVDLVKTDTGSAPS